MAHSLPNNEFIERAAMFTGLGLYRRHYFDLVCLAIDASKVGFYGLFFCI